VKSPDEVVSELERRLIRRWHEGVAGADSIVWSCDVPLGKPTKQVLEGDFSVARRWALDWGHWAETRDVTLTRRNRLVSGTQQALPTHVLIPDINIAARIVGKGWTKRLEVAQIRYAQLKQFFPNAATPAMLRSVDSLSEIDFELLCRAATWFASHDATGLTARQVPIEGLHSKWLNTNISLICDLAHKDNLGLVDRPHIVHFTYLDTDHLSLGGRRHDSTTVGDVEDLEYLPSVIIVSENKDTALFFPNLDGGIAIQGAGFAGAHTLAHIGWLTSCPEVLYWGDIDAAGFEIVNGLRVNGVEVRTILMDRKTFEKYEKYGASADRHGKPIECSARKVLTHLTEEERSLYLDLTDPNWSRVRRLEQERIPLDIARREIYL
jgi:hypothetical protein